MSERAIADPSQHGWVEVDGKWMWDSSGGGGGSIQDGDTEGQITTWDGTEWTPDGAVAVSNDSFLINTDSENPTAPSENVEGISMSSDFGVRASVSGNTLTLNRKGDFGDVALFRKDGERGGALSLSDGLLGLRGPSAAGNDAITIDADGTVNITSSTDTTKLNITNNLGVYEVVNNEYGSLAVNYNGAEQLVLASNGDLYVTGNLFVNGVEVGGGGGLWTDNGDGTISSAKTAKAPDFVTT